MKEKIILIGTGGHCHSVIDVIEQENKYDIFGIIDTKKNIGKKVLGYKIIGCYEDLEEIFKTCKNSIISLEHKESNELRKYFFEKVKRIGFNLPIIISPLAFVSKHSSIAIGTVIMHQAFIDYNTKIGENCIINTQSLIEHDCLVENNCHVSITTVLTAGKILKENSFWGVIL